MCLRKYGILNFSFSRVFLRINLRQKAVKCVAWTAIQSGGTQAISSSIIFLLARLLEPEVFGLVAMVGVFLVILQFFSEQGFTEAIIQRNKLESEHLDTAFWSNLGIGLLLPGLLGDKWIRSIPVMQVLAFVAVLFSISYFYGSIIMAMDKPDWVMKRSFLNAVSTIVAFSLHFVGCTSDMVIVDTKSIYVHSAISLLDVPKVRDIMSYEKYLFSGSACLSFKLKPLLLLSFSNDQILLKEYLTLFVK